MTVNEFCTKYDVPRAIVYEESFRLNDRNNFEPKEMADVLRTRIMKSKAYHQDKIEKSDAILKKIADL